MDDIIIVLITLKIIEIYLSVKCVKKLIKNLFIKTPVIVDERLTSYK